MLLTTTNNIEGRQITAYYGIVSGETIIGANIFRDFFASIRDIVGGRSGSYEKSIAGSQGNGFAGDVATGSRFGRECRDCYRS